MLTHLSNLQISKLLRILHHSLFYATNGLTDVSFLSPYQIGQYGILAV